MADNKVEKLAPGAKGKEGKEICRAFRNNGKCRFDSNCKYEHSTGALIDAPPRDYTPKGDCHNWTQSKECRFGERCRFLHGAEDKRTTYRVPKPENTTGEQEVCRNFQNRGKCRFGENCKHKHVKSDKKPATNGDAKDSGRPPRRRRRNSTTKKPEKKEAKAQASFDKDGVEICRNHLKGKCKYGADCSYSHAAPAGGSAPANSGARPARQERKPREVKDCTEFPSGKCEYGDDCRFKHGPKDTRDLSSIPRRRPRGGNAGAGACYSFQEKGECEYGDKCRFSHTA